ncbi:MAG: hypothetical protein ACREX8_21565 [Gammaproteobacteria bacterium]
MTEPITGQLTSTGWSDWASVRDVLDEDECFWIDLAGPHHGPAPPDLPVGATHLWSWRPDRWVRVRVDGDRALATVLTIGANQQGEAVTALVSEGLPWRQHSRAAEWEHPVTLVVTEGSAPITFVEVHPLPATG